MIDGVGREQEYCSVLGSVNTHFMIDYFHRGVYSIVFVLMGPFGSARLGHPSYLQPFTSPCLELNPVKLTV